jgi:hypothetical protein
MKLCPFSSFRPYSALSAHLDAESSLKFLRRLRLHLAQRDDSGNPFFRLSQESDRLGYCVVTDCLTRMEMEKSDYEFTLS